MNIDVLIEMSMGTSHIKYEVDHKTGVLRFDRFLHTSMHYPCNYGCLPNTIGGDNDAVDVLVITPYPLIPNCKVLCNVIGVLHMVDESGDDPKILAVPVDEVYSDWYDIIDVPIEQLESIYHFFEHYKDLDENKWAKVNGWGDNSEAKRVIDDGIYRYNNRC
jgi:inorganic pyrophosphatase